MDYLGIKIPDEVYEYLKDNRCINNFALVSKAVNEYIDTMKDFDDKLDILEKYEYIMPKIQTIVYNDNFRNRLFKYVEFTVSTDINILAYSKYFELLYLFSKSLYNDNIEKLSDNINNLIEVIECFRIPLPDTIRKNIIIFNDDKPAITKYVTISINSDSTRLNPFYVYTILSFFAYKYLYNKLIEKFNKVSNSKYQLIIRNLTVILTSDNIGKYIIDIKNILNIREDIDNEER